MYLQHLTVAVGDEIRRISVAAIESGDKLSFAISKCHKNDVFKRAKGRKIAEGRIFAGKFIKTVLVDNNNKRQFHEEAEAIAIDAIKLKLSPSGKDVKAKECKKSIKIVK